MAALRLALRLRLFERVANRLDAIAKPSCDAIRAGKKRGQFLETPGRSGGKLRDLMSVFRPVIFGLRHVAAEALDARLKPGHARDDCIKVCAQSRHAVRNILQPRSQSALL